MAALKSIRQQRNVINNELYSKSCHVKTGRLTLSYCFFARVFVNLSRPLKSCRRGEGWICQFLHTAHWFKEVSALSLKARASESSSFLLQKRSKLSGCEHDSLEMKLTRTYSSFPESVSMILNSSESSQFVKCSSLVFVKTADNVKDCCVRA